MLMLLFLPGGIVEFHIGWREAAEALLREMKELHRARARNVKPDDVMYNLIIQAWCRSSNPCAAAEQPTSIYKR